MSTAVRCFDRATARTVSLRLRAARAVNAFPVWSIAPTRAVPDVALAEIALAGAGRQGRRLHDATSQVIDRVSALAQEHAAIAALFSPRSS
jgi:hypothetical protein